MLPLLLAGMAGQVGGSILSGMGQEEGAKAAAKARQRQILEQEAIQAENNRNLQNELGTYNPSMAMDAARDNANAPAQMAIAKIAATNPGTADTTGAASAAMAAQNPSNAAAQRAAMKAQMDSGEGAQQNLSNRLSRLGSSQDQLEDRAGRLASLYDTEINTRASKGVGLRGMGNLLSSMGQGAMGVSGLMK